MGLLGLDWLESKQVSKIKNEAYLRSVYPYGKDQKDKICSILKSLFPNSKVEELEFNYIITKQELENKELYSLDKIQLIQLVDYLNNHFITRNNNIYPYLVLANIDMNINSELCYPSIDEINSRVNELIQLTR